MSTAFYATGLLVSATGSALLRKVLFQLSSGGAGGELRRFEKPWFTTFESALACWFSLFLYALASWLSRRRSVDNPEGLEHKPLLQEASPEEGAGKDGSVVIMEVETRPNSASLFPSWSRMMPLAWPAAFHMLSIIVQGEGLRYVTASVSQMIAGSCIIFTAILSVTILKCRLNWLHLTGIAMSLVGIIAVSLVSVIFPTPHPTPGNQLGSLAPAGMAWHNLAGPGNTVDGAAQPWHYSAGLGKTLKQWGPGLTPDPSLGRAAGLDVGKGPASGEMALGVGLTLLAMLVLAMRLVLEEMVVADDALHPMEVMGYEGFLGTLMMLFIGLPVAWLLPGNDPGGREENTIDSLYMLWNSRSLSAVNALFFFCVVGLNVFGLFVTQTLGSVFRAVLLTSRTATVWGVNLLLYALHVGGGSVGEPWLTPASWLQLIGFAILLAGTIIYAQGSSVAALVQVNIEDVLEEVGNREERDFQAGDGDEAESPLILTRRSVARVGSIARLPPTADAQDSIMIPRTHMLVGSGASLLRGPSLLGGQPSLGLQGISPPSGQAQASPFMRPLHAHPLASLPSSLSDEDEAAGPPLPAAATLGNLSIRASMGRQRSGPPGFVETLVDPGSWINSPASSIMPASTFGTTVRSLARQSMGAGALLGEDEFDLEPQR